MQSYDVIIIGAGGAGMMCALEAGKRGRKVALLDHVKVIGRKILISGGGRCNFTNTNTNPGAFVSQNPHFCKSALARFTPDDFIEMVKRQGIPFHEKKLGQLFCDGSAENIVNMLAGSCQKVRAIFHLNCHIHSIRKEQHFIVETSNGAYVSESLVIATGGLSIPQIGATGFGYQIAEQFGLKIVKPAPALDGFVFSESDLKKFGDLPGVSLDTTVSCNQAIFRENILFTHSGLSGPASLQASLYWNRGDVLEIDLLPGLDSFKWLMDLKSNGCRIEIKNLLAQEMPKRLAEKLTEFHGLKSIPLAQIAEGKLKILCRELHALSLIPERTVGYKKAEVTRGGVDTDELSSKTMEAKKVPGLFFVGEVVDVTGWLGGYNFQWAWSSGFAAGQQV